MLSPISERTRQQISELTRTTTIAGVAIEFCPCRLLPETVLNLKTVLRELRTLWEESLGDGYSQVLASPAGREFFAGDVRLAQIQEGRPEMVAVWVPFPPDYPHRLKVQLIDAVEPYELP